DEPERRDEPPGEAHLRAQAGWGGSSRAVRRLWWRGEGRALEEAAVASGSTDRPVDGGAIARAGGLRIGAGAIGLSDGGLLGEYAVLTRRTRGGDPGATAAMARAGRDDRSFRAAPGIGADLDGIALAWRGAARLLAGRMRRAEGDVVGAGYRRGAVQARGLIVRRAGGSDRFAGLLLEAGRPANRAKIEFAIGPSGSAARLAASSRSGPLRAAAVWRYDSGRERPGALDLDAAWGSRRAAARFRWRSWSAGGTAETAGGSTARGGYDDGRAELDLRAGRGGVGALRVRLGSKPAQGDGSGGERYAIGDLVVSREPGRSLRLTAGDRWSQAGDGWRRGRAMGAILELENPRRASLTVTAEAVRAEPGAGAYGSGLDVAGGGSIRARTRSGFRAAARGWIGAGDWRLGATVDHEESGGDEDTTAGESRAPRVNLWLAWSGGTHAR
ncbi:MAG TPA: hypothetical protein VFU59_09265, partial [Candidatus Eisenbacteria bacterium]|nr:hypothetical protein [Candidatus Eisenbacteria bacterium]